jgi:hypothetical protein
MKTPTTKERRDDEREPAPPKEPSKGSIRLVSPPGQTAVREWEITLPDELVARLTLNI